MHRFRGIALLFAAAAPLAAQRAPAHPTVVYAVGAEPVMPIPFFTHDAEADNDVADQLFLHLVTYNPGAHGIGDDAFSPALARSWHRVDPLTLVFDIDPRARWQDGVPVTAHDVIYSWKLANDPLTATAPTRVEKIAAVEEINEHSVRVRFRVPFPEQVYTFAFLMQPLPSHLLEKLSTSAIPASDFASHPIGNGPFRFVRRVPGQLIELQSDPAFFLGHPGIARVIFRVAADANTRVGLFLSGETDILDKIPPDAMSQVRSHALSRVLDLPSNALYQILINQRSMADTGRPHPALSDVRVREALTLALDRALIAKNAFGGETPVPDAAQSQIWSWVTGGKITPTAPNPVRARTLLAQSGWHPGIDGILTRSGTPLRLTLLYASTSAPANTMALQAQQMWRNVGIDVQLDRVAGNTILPRIRNGQWEMVINRVNQDPTPSSLTWSWSCASAAENGGRNFVRFCDTTFDHLVAQASVSTSASAWRNAFARMTLLHPAIFLAAASNQIAMQSRLENVIIFPSNSYLALWQWRVRPDAALARDR